MEKCGGTGFLTVRNSAAPEIKIVRDLCEDTKIEKERPSRRYRSRISRRLPVSLVTGNAEAPAVSGPRSGVTHSRRTRMFLSAGRETHGLRNGQRSARTAHSYGCCEPLFRNLADPAAYGPARGETAVPCSVTAHTPLPSPRQATVSNDMCLEIWDVPDFITFRMGFDDCAPKTKKGRGVSPYS